MQRNDIMNKESHLLSRRLPPWITSVSQFQLLYIINGQLVGWHQSPKFKILEQIKNNLKI